MNRNFSLSLSILLVTCLGSASCDRSQPGSNNDNTDAGPDTGADAAGDAVADAVADAAGDAIADADTDADAQSPCYPSEETWTGETPQATIDAPLILNTIVDPVFGNEVTRITQDGLYHHYSKTQPWNSNSTYVATANGGYFILDATTWAVLGNSHVPDGEKRWSTLDPDKMFHLVSTQLLSYSVSNDQSTLIRDFSASGCTTLRLGPWEGNLSIDDNRVAFACQVGSDLHFLLYDIGADTIMASRVFSGSWGDDYLDWVSVSQSGNYVVANWRDSATVRSYDTSLNQLHVLSEGSEHGDLCYDTAGNEVYVQVICGGHPDRGDAGIMAYRLDTGEKTVILPPDDFTCTGHISCRNFHRPGWAYVSSTTHHEVFAVKLDGSHTVEHVAHMHNTDNSPRAAPSPDGCMVMWASDWAGPIAAYVASHPSD